MGTKGSIIFTPAEYFALPEDGRRSGFSKKHRYMPWIYFIRCLECDHIHIELGRKAIGKPYAYVYRPFDRKAFHRFLKQSATFRDLMMEAVMRGGFVIKGL